MFLPIKTPIDSRIINGLLLPIFNLHRSLMDPKIGVRKNPIRGDKAQTKVICWCSTPIWSNVGETNAVSAAYENSIPITAADTLINSNLVLFLLIKLKWTCYGNLRICYKWILISITFKKELLLFVCLWHLRNKKKFWNNDI